MTSSSSVASSSSSSRAQLAVAQGRFRFASPSSRLAGTASSILRTASFFPSNSQVSTTRTMSSSADDQDARIMVFTKAGLPHEQKTVPLEPVRAALAHDEVLVKLTLATICGSDIHTILGQRIEPTPAVLGHEGVGEVLQSNRDDVKVGDRVTWSVADSCGSCHRCNDLDLPQKCQTLFKYGHCLVEDGSGLNGCYASHILIRSGTHLTPVPDRVGDRVVVAANCALATVCCVHEQIQQSKGPLKTVWVQGAGLLGLYMCGLLKAADPECRVVVSDVAEDRLELVEQFGGEPVVVSEIDEKLADTQFDAVVEVAGTTRVLPKGVEKTRLGGTYYLVGLVHPDSALGGVTGEQIIRKCMKVVGVHNYAPRHLDAGVKFLNDNIDKFPFEQLVSPAISLEELDTGVEMSLEKKYYRVSVDPWKSTESSKL